MVKKFHHYSMENPATVYDEESLTALQLAGRTAHKVNECVDAVNDFDIHMNAELTRFEKEVIPAKTKEAVYKNIEEGAFDESLDEYLKDADAELKRTNGRIDTVNKRVDNLIVTGGDSSPEVADLRLSVFNELYETAGTAVREQLLLLAERAEKKREFHFRRDSLISGEYIHNESGKVTQDTTGKFCRSRYLLPCKEGEIFVEDTECNLPLYISCFTKDMYFLGYVQPFNNTSTIVARATPSGTAFVGFSAGGNYFEDYDDDIVLTTIDKPSKQGIEYPFNGMNEEYVYVHNAFMNGNGSITYQYDTYDLCIFKVDGLASIYTNSTLLYNAIFFDGSNRVISNGSEFTVYGLGRSYNVPINARFVGINMPHSGTDENGHTTSYIALTKKNGAGLNGKRVLVIGDSLGWLDGREVAEAGCTQLVGWQAELRKRGALVHNLCASGATLAPDPEESGATCLTQQMTRFTLFPEENAGWNFYGYDVYIFMAGTNDIRTGIEPGYYGTQLANTYYDGIVLAGQLVSFENYGNTKPCDVFFCTPLYSKSSARPADAVFQFSKATKDGCAITGASCIDLCSNSGFNYNSLDTLTYDGTHPNRVGMQKLGRVIANHIEGCL